MSQALYTRQVYNKLTMTNTQIPMNSETKSKLESEMPYKMTFDKAVSTMMNYITEECGVNLRELFIKKLNEDTPEEIPVVDETN